MVGWQPRVGIVRKGRKVLSKAKSGGSGGDEAKGVRNRVRGRGRKRGLYVCV